jgi:hypothetical protein
MACHIFKKHGDNHLHCDKPIIFPCHGTLCIVAPSNILEELLGDIATMAGNVNLCTDLCLHCYARTVKLKEMVIFLNNTCGKLRK